MLGEAGTVSYKDDRIRCPMEIHVLSPESAEQLQGNRGGYAVKHKCHRASMIAISLNELKRPFGHYPLPFEHYVQMDLAK